MSKSMLDLDISLRSFMKYELILFDADGTLFDFEKASEKAIKNGLKNFKLDRWNSDTMTIYRKVNKQIWDEFELKLISAADLKTERFRRFFIEISIENVDPKEFSDYYLHSLSQNTDLINGAEDLVKWCYGKFKIGIITNGLTSVQKPRFSHSILDKYFEHYIISEELGFAKPHGEIFDYSLSKFNHSDKKSTIIIGDNLSSDIKGGNDYGIDTCWINFDNLSSNNILPTYEIKSLDQFKNILST